MAITLTELVREFAQSAVALDNVCSSAGYDLFIGDSDSAPDPDSSGSMSVPQIETVLIEGKPVQVPKATLRNQDGLQAKTMKLSVSSDVNLEGRKIFHEDASPPSAGSVWETVSDFLVKRGSRSNGNHIGFDKMATPNFGGAFNGTSDLTVNGTNHDIKAGYYVKTNERFVFRAAGSMVKSDFAGVQLRLRDPNDPDHDSVLEFDDANWDAGESMGSVYWPNKSDLLWIGDIPQTEQFRVTVTVPVNIELEIEGELEPQGEYRSEVVVTFREGLMPNAAHLKLEVEFDRQGPSEGVALVNDRLNHSLSEQLT